MNKDYRKFEKFALEKFKEPLADLNIETDYVIGSLFWQEKLYEIRVEGDEQSNGKYEWKLASSLELVKPGTFGGWGNFEIGKSDSDIKEDKI